MWKIKFPKTPEGEEVLAVYYRQKDSMYVKETIKGNVVLRYCWGGASDAFNFVEADVLVENL